MYLVGQLIRAHQGEPPQWDVVALRLFRTSAVRDCLANPKLFYVKLTFGKLPTTQEPIFPRRA